MTAADRNVRVPTPSVDGTLADGLSITYNQVQSVLKKDTTYV